MQKPIIVVLTGAGISAESGIQTFRGSGGLWNGHDVMEVASPEGWAKNPELVLDFYNKRRAEAAKAKPNDAHIALSKLEEKYEVFVVTQNVDDLHEQGGSSKVIHLHGKLNQLRSSIDESLIYDMDDPHQEVLIGDLCEKGSQLRPNIVWFGESVPLIGGAMALSEQADIFVVIGTSMQVYPAASLIHYVPRKAPKYFVDPHPNVIEPIPNLTIIEEKASIGVSQLVEQLLKA